MSSTLASPEVDKLGIQEPQTSSNPVEAKTETSIQTKNEKDSEKTRKKAEKAKKFAAKQKPAPGAASAKTATKKSLPPAVLEFTEQTPPGQKKILRPFSDDNDITKAYNPKAIESAWGAWWEAQGFFTPSNDTSSKSSFTIVIPPPNITVRWPLQLALQDCLIRWNRMHGIPTLYLPGCDHASLSAQAVVEQQIWRLQKQTRHDLGREKFIKVMWDWKDEYHGKINNALRRTGGSFDWTREAFTMDGNLSAAVNETFVRLHDEGIIYRANRLVNWCPALSTTLSNIELDNKELDGRTLLQVPGYQRKVEFGVITTFQYEIDATTERIEIATTRPETILGDTAIAVNPEDGRYKHLIGKKARHPFVERLLPIIADPYVSMDFGTGSHDPNDFKIGQEHNLEFINIMNDDGTLNHNAGQFEGMKRFDARYEVINALKEKGLYVKWDHNAMTLPLCSKSKDVIEPVMKPQWWMRMESLAKPAVQAVRQSRIRIRPASAEKSFYSWMDSIHDWCISRQLWWGHQAPAYFIELMKGEKKCEPENEDMRDESDANLWVAARSEDEAWRKAEAKFPKHKFRLKRDPDALDTWFSAALWPFSTLGWPKETRDMQSFYPTSVLETGWDILFFWCARMIMLGLKMTGTVPFKEIYCHGLIRDAEGRKMSKSLGNVIDPLDIVEGISLEALNDKLKDSNLAETEIGRVTRSNLQTYPQGIKPMGMDPLRFALINYTTGSGEDVNFDLEAVEASRKFCNKIYQATKFALSKFGSNFVPETSPKLAMQPSRSLAERWILHKMDGAIGEVNTALESRDFSIATQAARRYFWDELCDIYIENSKSLISDGTDKQAESAKQTLYTSLEGGLLTLHPFMPFLTEELWQRLPRRSQDATPSITIAAYPTHAPSFHDPVAAQAYDLLNAASKGIRSLTGEYGIKGTARIFIKPLTESAYDILSSEVPSLHTLAFRTLASANSAIEVLTSFQPLPTQCISTSVGTALTILLHVAGKIDVNAEITKTKKKIMEAKELGKKTKRRIDDWEGNDNIAPEARREEIRRLNDKEAETKTLEDTLAQLETMGLS
ncbi:MAG: valine--tRNA ligase [Alectoria sarmentosa]|nr:MAG: valine--tRNA ligase [Alectoria sarmentosa]